MLRSTALSRNHAMRITLNLMLLRNVRKQPKIARNSKYQTIALLNNNKISSKKSLTMGQLLLSSQYIEIFLSIKEESTKSVQAIKNSAQATP